MRLREVNAGKGPGRSVSNFERELTPTEIVDMRSLCSSAARMFFMSGMSASRTLVYFCMSTMRGKAGQISSISLAGVPIVHKI
jgi:hypothetical protein